MSEEIELEVKAIGPIKNFNYTFTGPGVYVGRGANGSGKSTLIRAVSKRLGGDTSDLSVHDGAPRGSLQLGEARLTVTQSRQTNSGELEILSIEGSLDIGALVDPGIKNAGKADEHRIKTLIALSGIEPDGKLFHEIAGGEAAYLALGVDEKGADLLTLAARVKRAIEAQARTREETADSYLEKYRAAKAAADGAPDGESDEKKLAEALAAAQSTFDRMVRENQLSDEAAASARVAARQLAEIGELSDDHGELFAEAGYITRTSIRCQEEADALRKQAADLEAEAIRLSSDADDLLERGAKAQKAAEKRQRLADEAARAVPAGHGEEQIAEASQAVDDALAAVETGAVIRNARAKAAEADSHATAAKAAKKLARKLREAASEVDGALSKLLPKQCPLRVEAGRLVCETDRGKSELYEDLSFGEKWRVAFDFAAEQCPRGGMFTLDQVAWEGLAPALRNEIATLCVSRGITLLTAEVSDDPDLHVEQFKVDNGSTNN